MTVFSSTFADLAAETASCLAKMSFFAGVGVGGGGCAYTTSLGFIERLPGKSLSSPERTRNSFFILPKYFLAVVLYGILTMVQSRTLFVLCVPRLLLRFRGMLYEQFSYKLNLNEEKTTNSQCSGEETNTSPDLVLLPWA